MKVLAAFLVCTPAVLFGQTPDLPKLDMYQVISERISEEVTTGTILRVSREGLSVAEFSELITRLRSRGVLAVDARDRAGGGVPAVRVEFGVPHQTTDSSWAVSVITTWEDVRFRERFLILRSDAKWSIQARTVASIEEIGRLE